MLRRRKGSLRLSPLQLKALIRLWEHCDKPVLVGNDKVPMMALERLGLAKRDLSGSWVTFRITRRGIMRLEDPEAVAVLDVMDK